MPAESDPAPALPDLPQTWRPLGPMIMGVMLLVGLFVIGAATWMGFDDQTKEAFDAFQRATVIFLFLLVCVTVHALVRSRVEARPEKLIVVNGYRRRDLDWAEIVAVQLPRGAPWATIDLADGTNISAMGIQSSDGARARTAVRSLRAYATRQAR